ncbi:SRPBCC family protein [Nonomuraea sp. NN258]|uniref:SRPBCC family protein n=1 Tax=Nonomuraea antri TaxID=2730852 RepID=UPI001569C442|nr:SRPBCC family protein [Nonomuraea antri]NRQ36794.1 SRPBCC family protein [Nonomuraea antri]
MKEFAGGPQYTLTGQVMVTLPPEEAFSLFTPRGEELWVRGWEPRFPLPVDDDTVPGTVFETRAHDETTIWVVIDREEGRRVSYARVTPGKRAGTVTVTVLANGRGGSTAEVTYRLTALSPEGERELNEFADEYQDFLKSWEEAIAEYGANRS